ncbi:FecR family protein [Pedobacter sp. MW01-1-1]|uniref:FecR family protein n=1 Tax=Pedobacter sp. MW01-1-1 TaxID=3383027 RepID=UPI003FED5734
MEQRAKYLIERFQENLLTHQEKEELRAIVNEHPDLVSDSISRLIEQHEANAAPVDQKKWLSVINRIVQVDKPVLKKKSFSIYFKWAAAAMFIVGIAVVFKSYQLKKKVHVFAADFAPGSKKAVLTLANGKKIVLNDLESGKVIKDAGFSISKTADGEIIYTIEKVADNNSKLLNTITTPNGGQWQVHLADGSTVWLNAGSSLEYSLNIGVAKVRKVKLIGEGYFEVAKNSNHPFIVETPTQRLEVLGTHFNINSYRDEVITRTTLLEGSVRISDLDNPAAFKILKPGEQCDLSEDEMNITAVNVEEAIAWKNGYFMFNNEKQESILRKIARWYDVQIEYANPEAKEVVYYGTISRFDNISKVLHKFEETGQVRFDIKGNKIIVYKE